MQMKNIGLIVFNGSPIPKQPHRCQRNKQQLPPRFDRVDPSQLIVIVVARCIFVVHECAGVQPSQFLLTHQFCLELLDSAAIWREIFPEMKNLNQWSLTLELITE